jgi:ABC-2 type transport system ATP-binding protein
LISVRNFSHSYGALRALDDVSLNVAAGQVVGLVGPNGAGKTTLMRAIATLLRPPSGTVAVAGHDVAKDSMAVRRLLGYLPERASLYPELAAWEYLDLFAEMAGHGPRDRARRVSEALERVALASRRDARVRELSKGLKQRLALQATLMHDPRVLVLDEPTDGLDPLSRGDVLTEVRAFAKDGRAVLLSSHVLAEVEKVADETVILAKGKRVVDDQPTVPRYAIRIRGDSAQARELLAARADVVSAVVSNGRVVVELTAGAPDAGAIVEALLGAGFPVVELIAEHTTLEQRFARATRDA